MTSHARSHIIFIVLSGFFGLVISRLFYWQIIRGPELRAVARSQYISSAELDTQRGSIYTKEGYLLVTNQPAYRVFAKPQEIITKKEDIANSITEILLQTSTEYLTATDSAVKDTLKSELTTDLLAKLTSEKQWIALRQRVNTETKKQIEALNYQGIGFEEYLTRAYPEASMAAHITGFVGKDNAGEDQGYFGIEGALDKELRGQVGSVTSLRDAVGFRLDADPLFNKPSYQGRHVYLTIRRDVQLMLETALRKGVEQYGAKSGEIVVLEPSTGQIIGIATWPQYDQATFYTFPPELYKNPSLTQLYEPGSTFKVLTVAAGIDAGHITPETTCGICDKPYEVGKYTIKTWNEEYHPNITMTEALAKSDNIAMIDIAQKLGNDSFKQYLEAFGIGQATLLDLQEDHSPGLPSKWGPVELATRSFGQGIVTNTLQLARAVGAIANQGAMMKPYIVSSVYDPASQETITTEPSKLKQVISPESAQKVTDMMVYSAGHGEAQWIASKEVVVAGKTGTSQVASQDGGYLKDATIASFVGFAPANAPKFVMVVKLNEPSSSPWAAETAAPLWYQVAEKLVLLL